jgi:hypothetical protein
MISWDWTLNWLRILSRILLWLWNFPSSAEIFLTFLGESIAPIWRLQIVEAKVEGFVDILLKYLWRRMLLMPGRFWVLTLRMVLIRSISSRSNSVENGMVYFILSRICSFVRPLNGTSPETISNSKIPNAQISTFSFSSSSRKTSGGIY